MQDTFLLDFNKINLTISNVSVMEGGQSNTWSFDATFVGTKSMIIIIIIIKFQCRK